MNSVHIVERFDRKFEFEYENFIIKNGFSMMYHSIKYAYFLTSLIKAKPYYLVAREDEEINGVLPLMYIDGKYGRVLNSLPYYGSNGSILSSTEVAKKLLIDKYNEVINKKNIASSTIITNPFDKKFDSSLINYNNLDVRIGQITEIQFNESHEKNILQKIHYKTRNTIRKAIKSNVEVYIENSKLDAIYKIHKKNMNDIGGLPKQIEILDSIRRTYTSNDDYKVYVAKLGKKIIAGLLVFYFKDTVEYYMPVVKKDYRNIQPLSLIIFRAMIDASINGFKYWNWGGTWESQKGVYLFKKRWGTKTENYYYLNNVVNEEIYSCDKEFLLNEYQSFYVIPFKKLAL